MCNFLALLSSLLVLLPPLPGSHHSSLHAPNGRASPRSPQETVRLQETTAELLCPQDGGALSGRRRTSPTPLERRESLGFFESEVLFIVHAQICECHDPHRPPHLRTDLQLWSLAEMILLRRSSPLGSLRVAGQWTGDQ